MTWKHFTLHEFKCPCCGENKIKTEFVNLLDNIRERAGVPMVVTSGYRCPTYDISLGGKGNHPTGYAADIAIGNSYIRHAILEAAYHLDVERIGVGQNFVHLDILDQFLNYNKPAPRTWVY
jgi:uncharacterized protein YcbK (DUF882 family)